MTQPPADDPPAAPARRGRRAAPSSADDDAAPATASLDVGASPWWGQPGGASLVSPSALREAPPAERAGWVPEAPTAEARPAPHLGPEPEPAAGHPVVADAPATTVLPTTHARTRRELRELEQGRRARTAPTVTGPGTDEPRGSTPDGVAPDAPAAPRAPRAGRNLPAAIGVGVLLGGLVVASLFARKEAFVAVVAVAAVLGVRELAGAFATRHLAVPVVPLAVGSVGMLVSGYVAGQEGLLVSFVLTAFGVVLWRIIDGLRGAVRDVVAAVFAAAYVPLLAGFAILMLAEDDGPLRIVVFITTTVASDIGGYIAGVLFGKHPMAPTISPKKSWEGFVGSALACLGVGVAGVTLLLQGPWWAGAAVGAATVVTATLGDLSESLLKRDLGIKDMGSILPGHGGFMDRLDSLLPTAPVVFLLLATLVPVA